MLMHYNFILSHKIKCLRSLLKRLSSYIQLSSRLLWSFCRRSLSLCVYIPALIWIQWLDMRSPSSVFSSPSPPPSNVCSHLMSLEWMSFWNDFSGKACHKSVLPPSNNSKTRKTGLTTEPLSQYFHSVFTFWEEKNGV